MTEGRAVCAILLTFCMGCGRRSEPAADRAPERLILGPEDVAPAVVAPVLTGPLVSGELEARDRASVRAQLAGSVYGVDARIGQRVKQGQILGRIRAAAEREAVGSAEAALRTAEAELDVARREAERTEVLVKAGALATRDLEQSRTAVESARARVAEANARLAAAREQLGESVVRAPLTGVISAAPVNSGDVVSVGAELFTIVDPYTMELRASIPAEGLGALRVGSPVEFTVQGYGDRIFRGEVTRISPAADPATKQIEVFASIPNAGGVLIEGLYAQGRVATGEQKAVVVPQSAALGRGGMNYVLKLEGGKVVEQQVKLGVKDSASGRVQILSGLAPGDLVLVGAATEVRPGAEVELRQGAEERR